MGEEVLHWLRVTCVDSNWERTGLGDADEDDAICKCDWHAVLRIYIQRNCKDNPYTYIGSCHLVGN